MPRRKLWMGEARSVLYLVLVLSAFGLGVPATTSPEFDSQCPLQFDKLQVGDFVDGVKKPYLFGQTQLPICQKCNNKRDYWTGFCGFHHRAMNDPVGTCKPADQKKLVDFFMDRAAKGVPGAESLLTLSPCDLWPFIRGRTLWIAGDSMSQEFARAFQCFFFEFWEAESSISHVSHNVGDWLPQRGAVNFCIQMPDETRMCFIRANKGSEFLSHVLPLLTMISRPTDIFLANFALHTNEEDEYLLQVAAFAEFVRAHRQMLPFMMWRDCPVQHFNSTDRSGDWRTHMQPPVCVPLDFKLDDQNKLQATAPGVEMTLKGGFHNLISAPFMAKQGIPVVDTWNQSVPHWNLHYNFNTWDRSGQDCTHFCHPSVYQIWLHEFYQTLQASRALLPHAAEEPPVPLTQLVRHGVFSISRLWSGPRTEIHRKKVLRSLHHS